VHFSRCSQLHLQWLWSAGLDAKTLARDDTADNSVITFETGLLCKTMLNMSSRFALNYGGNHIAVKKWWHIPKRRFVVVLKYFHTIKCLFHQLLIKMINTSVLIYCVRVYKPLYLTHVYIRVHTCKIPVVRSPCLLNSGRRRLSFLDSQWRTYSCHTSGAWDLEAVPRYVENIYIPLCVPTRCSSGLRCYNFMVLSPLSAFQLPW